MVKPFTAETLGHKIREVLGGERNRCPIVLVVITAAGMVGGVVGKTARVVSVAGAYGAASAYARSAGGVSTLLTATSGVPRRKVQRR